MPRICYVEKRFAVSSRVIIDCADDIIEEYKEQGFNLTLRQLYYQFVSRDDFPDDRTWRWTGSRWVKDPNGTKNATPNYKWLGGIINDARLAGLIDWKAIEDRVRNLIEPPHWNDKGDIINSAADGYALDKWQGQEELVEVWVEKEALIDIVEQACEPLDVPCYACKGYVSQSEMWRASQRFKKQRREDQEPVIIHLGDHDPSGIDMSRDIRERLEMFGANIEVIRIALNMDQIRKYSPPPNPAKQTDSRFSGYVEKYGDESWELDALEPSVLHELIQNEIGKHLDQELYNKREELQEEQRKPLREAAERWGEVEKFLAKKKTKTKGG